MQHIQVPVAQEGAPFLIFSALCSLVFALLGLIYPALFFLALTGFVLYFFRDPVRVLPTEAGAIVAPADGKVIVVQEVEDTRFLGERVQKISIFMNVFNVHSNRAPIASRVEQKWYNPGRFLNAALDKASVENERCALHLKTADGRDVTCVQIAGLVARRILNYVEPGTALSAGQRYGFIRFGSRVDLYLPLDTQVKVVIGEKVFASSSILAELA